MIASIIGIVMLVAILVGLAKHGRGGKYRAYIAGPIDEKFALGTLSASSVIISTMAEVVVEKTWLSSVRAAWALQNYTTGTDDGPIMVGIAHSDYSAAEVEEWIENTAGWSQADLVAQEVGRRKIRKVGIFESPASAAEDSVLNDGKAITTKCNWLLLTGQTISLWAYNMGDSNLATTDPDVHVQGKANLWPR